MFEKIKTTITLLETVNGKKNFKVSKDITEMSSDELVNVFVSLMKFQSYHEVSIWRALRSQADDMVEYFDSIESSKGEWDEDYHDSTD